MLGNFWAPKVENSEILSIILKNVQKNLEMSECKSQKCLTFQT